MFIFFYFLLLYFIYYYFYLYFSMFSYVLICFHMFWYVFIVFDILEPGSEMDLVEMNLGVTNESYSEKSKLATIENWKLNSFFCTCCTCSTCSNKVSQPEQKVIWADFFLRRKGVPSACVQANSPTEAILQKNMVCHQIGHNAEPRQQ